MYKQLPQSIQSILQILESHHEEAFLVGGCVRDFFLHRKIHDFDIATSAKPETTMHIFQEHGYHVIPTGIKHGTITIHCDDQDVEVTTYRIESKYVDHRHPTHVAFTKNLKEDLHRRDLTINAIAYHPKTGFYDPFGGQLDLARKQIRCVGDATCRFEEDALRILRAIRFQCLLGFQLDDACKEAIIEKSSLLSYISKERIRDEFNKILSSNRTNTLQLLHDLNVLEKILPGYSIIYQYPQKTPWHCYDVFTHTDVALNHSMDAPLILKLALVFHDLGKPSCETFDNNGIAHYKRHAIVSEQLALQFLKLLKYDNKTIHQVCLLIRYHDWYVHEKRSCMRRYLALFEEDYDLAFLGLQMQLADDYAKDLTKVTDKIATIETCIQILHDIQNEKDMVFRKELAINGNDVKALQIYGKEIKDSLDAAYLWVLEDPKRNQKEQLRSYLINRRK